MSLQELRKMPHLSASSINGYIDCGLSYKFGRIDKVQREFIADSLEYGSVIHKVLGEFYQNKLTGIKLSLKDIHTMFETYWTESAKRRSDLKYAEGKSFESYLLEGKELLTVYYDKLPADNFKVLAIEEAFSLNLAGIDMPIIGAFDLLEEDESGTIILTDWKTTGRAYSVDEIDKNFQLTVYNLALKSNGYADREILLKFDCLIKTKTPKFEQYYTTRSIEDMHRAIVKIMQVYDGIQKEVFIANDGHWKCGGCAFKNHCDAWFKGGA